MESSTKLTKRLSILQELRTVTETMRALSAVNIRRYENATLAVSEHDSMVDLGFQALSINSDLPVLQATKTVKSPAQLVIIFGSDHGLCGRFNERVIEFARTSAIASSKKKPLTTLDSLLCSDEPPYPCRLLVAGQVLSEVCTANGFSPYETFSLPGIVDSIPELVHKQILQIDKWVHQHPDSRLDVFHHRPSTDNGIELNRFELLPVQRSVTSSGNWPTHNLPGITLQPETLLAALLREHIFIGLYRSCAESQSAEHISRLSSMQAACRSIDEQISTVGQKLRKHRQMLITSELLDTISGYESIVRR